MAPFSSAAKAGMLPPIRATPSNLRKVRRIRHPKFLLLKPRITHRTDSQTTTLLMSGRSGKASACAIRALSGATHCQRADGSLGRSKLRYESVCIRFNVNDRPCSAPFGGSSTDKYGCLPGNSSYSTPMTSYACSRRKSKSHPSSACKVLFA